MSLLIFSYTFFCLASTDVNTSNDSTSVCRERATRQQIPHSQPYDCANQQNVTMCAAASGTRMGIQPVVIPVKQACTSNMNIGVCLKNFFLPLYSLPMLIHYFRVHMPAFLLISIAPYWLFIFLCASKILHLQVLCPQSPKTRVSRGLPTSSSCSHGTTRNTRRHVVRDTSLHHCQSRTIPSGEGPSSVGIQGTHPYLL